MASVPNNESLQSSANIKSDVEDIHRKTKEKKLEDIEQGLDIDSGTDVGEQISGSENRDEKDQLETKHGEDDALSEVEKLDRIIDDAYNYLEHLTDEQKITDLNIFLPFEVPLCHTIEKHITHGVSESEHKKLKELKIKFKNGRFNPKEDEILKANWESFCEKYDFRDPEPFLPGVTNRLTVVQRRKFVQWLGRGLENRSLNSIFSRFRLLLCSSSEIKRFTDFEDKLIKRCMERKLEMPFVLLSKILNRDRMYISKHYRLMHKAAYSGQGKVRWTMSMVQVFLDTLLKCSDLTDVEHLRYVSPSPRAWEAVGSALKLPASRCRNFWNRKLSTQLFAEQPVSKHHLCTMLLVRFWRKNKKYVYWQDIKWSKVAKHYKGIGPIFLAKTFKSFIQENVPQKRWKSLKACLKFLKKHWLPRLPETKFTVNLIRLRYINGKLITLTDK